MPCGYGISSSIVVLITFGCKINKKFATKQRNSLKKPLTFAEKY